MSRRPVPVAPLAAGGARRQWALGFLTALSCFLIPVSSTAQTARLAVLADSVSAGAPFEVAVRVVRGPGQQVQFPDVPPGDVASRPALALGDAEILSIQRLPPAVRGGARVDSAVVRAVTFAADSARVGPLAVRVVQDGDTLLVRTGVAVVPVRSVLAGEAEPYEPAPVGPPETFASATALWVGVGALALLVAGGLAWAVLGLLRRPKAAERVAPYPAAVARFDALDREAPAADAMPEQIEAHVVAVRDALRQYLADRLGLPVREATTAEVEALLAQDDRVPEEAADAVRRALRPTDLVAFARVRPAPDVVARLRAEGRAAVEAVERGVRGTGSEERAEHTQAAPVPRSSSPAP